VRVLQRHHVQVNKSTGLHSHIDCSDLSPRQVCVVCASCIIRHAPSSYIVLIVHHTLHHTYFFRSGGCARPSACTNALSTSFNPAIASSARTSTASQCAVCSMRQTSDTTWDRQQAVGARGMRYAACATQYAIHSMRYAVCDTQYATHSMRYTVCATQYTLTLHTPTLHTLTLHTPTLHSCVWWLAVNPLSLLPRPVTEAAFPTASRTSRSASGSAHAAGLKTCTTW
jgi:hypothetical protein